MDEVVENIQAVRLDDIIALANDIFMPEKLTLVCLGKVEQGELSTEGLL